MAGVWFDTVGVYGKNLSTEVILKGDFWYKQASFYAKRTFLKKSCKSNRKFPFKAVYFLGVRGLRSSYIVCDFTSSGTVQYTYIFTQYIF